MKLCSVLLRSSKTRDVRMSKHSNIPSILGDYDMDAVMQEAARRNMLSFSRYMTPDLDVQPFHRVYYTVLDMFAHGKIKKLIVQMPPSAWQEPRVEPYAAGLYVGFESRFEDRYWVIRCHYRS